MTTRYEDSEEGYCPKCNRHIQDCDCPEEGETESYRGEFTGPWSVATFLIDRAYGGPEEGGWYYGTGEPVIAAYAPLPVFYATEEGAKAGLVAMRAEIERLKLNEGRRDINSVLSEGIYDARICDGAPEAFPKTRPHYE